MRHVLNYFSGVVEWSRGSFNENQIREFAPRKYRASRLLNPPTHIQRQSQPRRVSASLGTRTHPCQSLLQLLHAACHANRSPEIPPWALNHTAKVVEDVAHDK